MSLDYQYLCCDGWWISLEEFDDDEFCIDAMPRPRGQPRGIPRPAKDPQELIQSLGLPIRDLEFKHHVNRMGRSVAVYKISWQEGTAFLRKYLLATASGWTGKLTEIED